MGNVLNIEKFNEKFRLKVTDIVGDFFGEKTFYQFENWEEISFSYRLVTQKVNVKLKSRR